MREVARCLADGETLAIEVLDVDLAGRNEWWHRAGHDLRVMRAITWPRLDLRYVWRDATGTVLQEGRERVTDMDYLRRSARVRFATVPLPDEQAMLRDWFARRFCRAAGAAVRTDGQDIACRKAIKNRAVARQTAWQRCAVS
ncbi:MAG: DUF3016 domain-containing protein [Candidatus Competibacteraceae bacterium]|nr:MAG: DUF3016 domain-containing protein [Candidatus Competibacteraceae bacterium]